MEKHCYLFYYIVVICLLFSCKKETPVVSNSLVTKTEATTINLEGKTIEELRLLRNEIFAKKGYVFKDSVLNDHFSKQEWYTPNKNAQIVLSESEKERVAIFKKAEEALKPFKLPRGYTKVTWTNVNGEIIEETVKQDIDGDQIVDVIQVAKSDKDATKVMFISLSKRDDLQKIYITDDEYDETTPGVVYRDGVVAYGLSFPGTAHYEMDMELRYNSKINNLQLIRYIASHRTDYGHISKEYDLITGSYKVTKEEATEDNDTINKNVYKGKQETRAITPESIDAGLYFYLGIIGDQYEDMNDFDCTDRLVEELVLEFEYGKLNYLKKYDIFEKDLKDFVNSIDIDVLNTSPNKTYTKTYRLHRDWDLNYIERDNCKDKLFFTIDDNNKIVRIMINNCSIYKEEGAAQETTEESVIFEYKIGPNCTYEFYRVSVAG